MSLSIEDIRHLFATAGSRLYGGEVTAPIGMHDDAAKVIGLSTPDAEHFLPRIEALVKKEAR
ncbi:hypothetical protein D3870_19715 [Noviherbaspirillum cavernae]|uniref:Uncharacterized protein n=1 Tax=Noviherbaspirillum cavernae TaxID=2320862 RepID=A0A418WVB5_9BURK|nr:hypothetical protein [Noviherbaspirillum cavernae]RJF96652.1 hypothetical protein D3870_19715 [Noviherbaspirillum cavernae]